jgi:7-cyano-7-deazaguanine synthase in queuosine biosynthesis
MNLRKTFFPEVNIVSILIAIGWILWVGYILFASGNIFLGVAVIAGMTCNYLNIYHDCRHHYLMKEIEEDISRLEKEHQEQIEKRQQSNYEELERHSI